ncbi:hypothetical protein ACXZ1K_08920 [Pedobacter sp. PWIIR3]
MKLIKVLLFILSGAFLLVMTRLYFPEMNAWLLLLILIAITVLTFFIYPFWKIKPMDISRYLDRHFPELEESSGLLLSEEELHGLQQLQVLKVNEEIATIKIPWFYALRFRTVSFLFLSSLFLMLTFLYFKPAHHAAIRLQASKALLANSVKENIPAAVSSVSIRVLAPSYTSVSPRDQKQFTMKVETGSRVVWKITTNATVGRASLIFDDQLKVAMTPLNKSHTVWSMSRNIADAGFYQVEIDGVKSDLYQIDVIPDLPVDIKVTHPKQHSAIDIGQPSIVNLKLLLSDDYGVRNAFISATMASGKGEGVSFTEKKLPLNVEFNNKRNISLKKVIDLKSLGMKPGDELYFFINAMDNQGKMSRSDVFFVSIVDTTELMSMAGMTSGVNLVPEYFRSQRQIIIDTEKLLKEKDSINAQDFKNRSNDIGVDQKLLRLRYGKFLGEENETEIGADHDHKEGGEQHGDKGKPEEKFGDVKGIMDQYAHKHDIAEDATFFEPELKVQLKAVLTEMWSSELKLRTYVPQEALPFEYKALRLLKDLQQKSRAYVAKTTVKTAQLKDEKRLSGEMDKIVAPLQKAEFKETEMQTEKLRQALAILEKAKADGKLGDDERMFIKRVEKYVLTAATANPSSYLPGLKALRKISNWVKIDNEDIASAEVVISKMIPGNVGKIIPNKRFHAVGLYQSYFKTLNRSEK